VVTTLQVRRFALGLPETVELPHHGVPSFRVHGRIFATLPDDEHLNIRINPDDAAEALSQESTGCSELWWGQRLRGVRVTLSLASDDVVAALLTDAWRHRAPRTLTGRLPEDHRREPTP
jgi:hypothetical protein